MKRLLAEKNAALERMERKLEEARAAERGTARADRTEAARLTDRQNIAKAAHSLFLWAIELSF